MRKWRDLLEILGGAFFVVGGFFIHPALGFAILAIVLIAIANFGFKEPPPQAEERD